MALLQLVKELFNVKAKMCSKIPRFTVVLVVLARLSVCMTALQSLPKRGYRPHFPYLAASWLPVAVKTAHNPNQLGYGTLPARPAATYHQTPLTPSGRHRGLMARWRHSLLPRGRLRAPPTPRGWRRGVARNRRAGDVVRHPALASGVNMPCFRMQNYWIWAVVLSCEIWFQNLSSSTILSQ